MENIKIKKIVNRIKCYENTNNINNEKQNQFIENSITPSNFFQ